MLFFSKSISQSNPAIDWVAGRMNAQVVIKDIYLLKHQGIPKNHIDTLEVD
jgi:hypothetical protein